MRKALLSSALVAVMFGPLLGRAAPQEEVESTPTTEAAPSPARPEAGQLSGPSGAHRVERGDTLWDLSQRFLGSPWYWPKVWSYNPQIANPHWIYPGNNVKFYPTGEEVPVELGAGPQVDEVDEIIEEDNDRLTVAGKIGYQAKGAITLAGNGFVTAREVEESGTIIGSFAESTMLSFPQTFYGRLRDNRMPRLGDSYIIFRNSHEVIHPDTHLPVGFLTKIIGSAKVTRVEKNGVATFVIEKQFDEIRRSDLLGPIGEGVSRSVVPRPNDKDLKGATVVGATNTFLTQFGEHSLVIIDKGSDDGVKAGNLFVVTRQNDFNSEQMVLSPMITNEEFPVEDIGMCMAFEVKATASTCFVVQSMREIVKGDHLEMRARGSKHASR